MWTGKTIRAVMTRFKPRSPSPTMRPVANVTMIEFPVTATPATSDTNVSVIEGSSISGGVLGWDMAFSTSEGWLGLKDGELHTLTTLAGFVNAEASGEAAA